MHVHPLSHPHQHPQDDLQLRQQQQDCQQRGQTLVPIAFQKNERSLAFADFHPIRTYTGENANTLKDCP